MLRLTASLIAVAFAASAAAADRLVVQLNGGWAPQHAGFAVAQADGLYASEGLDVAFRPGRSLDPLVRGEVELAVEHAAPALFIRERGANPVNIAQVLKRPTAVIVCAASAGVNAPADLREQRFVRPAPGQEPALELALAIFGVVRPLYAESAPCRLGRTFEQRPSGATAFPLADMGVELLEDGVWALDFALQDAAFAARATRFLRASLEGWARFARAPKTALDKLDRALQERFAPAAAGVVAALGPGELGRMDEAAFRTTVRLLMLGWIEPALAAPPEGAWRDDLRAAARPASAAPARARGK
jgi:NitT/TauT family transport system substrate-binding protein